MRYLTLLGLLFIVAISILSGTALHAQEAGAPRIAYLGPASSDPHNIFIIGQDETTPTQLTSSETGIHSFAANPDGLSMVYAEHNQAGTTTTLNLLDLQNGDITLLIDCGAEVAACTNPVWHPDGTKFVYEHDVRDDTDPPHIMLVDMNQTPPSIAPLMNDTDVFGQSPVWSADGSTLTFYDSHANHIILYNMAEASIIELRSQHGNPGTFSPDGTQLVYPDLVMIDGNFFSRLTLANLTTRRQSSIIDDVIAEDTHALWTPDSSALVVRRRYLDERFTTGYQFYLVSPITGDSKPLLVDDSYNHGFFAWNTDQTALVIQRFMLPEGAPTADITPEIWTYDVATKTLTQIAVDAFLPQWVQ